jgi:regulator of RNase E activity RraB
VGLFRKQSKADDGPIDPNDRSPQLGLRYKDLAVLRSLVDNGADLDQPRHVFYYSYFGDPDRAEQAAADARAAGFAAKVRDPLVTFPDDWGVVAELEEVVVDPDFVRSSDDLFQELADRLGGEYDGWEASV